MPTYTSGSATFGSLVSDDYRVAALEGIFLNGAPQIWLDPWLGTNITYSFPTGAALWDGGLNYGKGEISAGWFPMSAAQQAVVRQALDAWSTVSAVKFTEVADGATVGDLRFGFTYSLTAPTLGWAYSPATGNARAGDVWINASLASKTFGPNIKPFGAYNQDSAVNYQILMHEIGHALGLSHPFATAGETRGTAPLPAAEDNYNNTVMSYSPYPEHGGIASTPMVYDILAIQLFYGRDLSHNTGNTTYTYDINDIQLLTIWDAAGEDTIAVTNNSNITQSNGTNLFSIIDLREGAASKIGFLSTTFADPYYSPGGSFGWRSAEPNIYIAYGAVIENAVGTNGNDLITGNSSNNKITGGPGSDAIDGGTGIDTSIYSLARNNYTLAKTATGWTIADNFASTFYHVNGAVPAPSGFIVDTLTSMERLKFSDVSVALDLAGNAGITAKILGAVFGKAEVANKAYVGVGLSLLDGGMSYPALMQAALDVKLGASFTNTAAVNLLYTNVVGSAPGAADLAFYVGLLNNGTYTAASLGVLAADTSFNTGNINLVGLTSSGIEYV